MVWFVSCAESTVQASNNIAASHDDEEMVASDAGSYYCPRMSMSWSVVIYSARTHQVEIEVDKEI
jgi:hypothetical protein